MANGRKDDTAAQPGEALTDNDKAFSAISYILGILVALVIYLVKKENGFVRFHAVQSILVDIVVFVISIIAVILFFAIFAIGMVAGGIGVLVAFPLFYVAVLAWGLLLLAIRLFLAWKAYNGGRFMIPLLGGLAERFSAT